MYDAYPTNFSYPAGSYPNFYNTYSRSYPDAYQPCSYGMPRYGYAEYNIPQEITNGNAHGLSSCERVPPLSHPSVSRGMDSFGMANTAPASADFCTTLHHFPPTPPPTNVPLALEAQNKNTRKQPSSVVKSSESKKTGKVAPNNYVLCKHVMSIKCMNAYYFQVVTWESVLDLFVCFTDMLRYNNIAALCLAQRISIEPQKG